MEERLRVVEVSLASHLKGCEEQNKSVNATLSRLEGGINGLYRRYWGAVAAVIAAQGAVLLAIFSVWLHFGHK